MLAAFVHEIDRVEDLHRMVGVHGRDHPRDRGEVAVEERAQATIVVDRTGAGPAAHEQLEAGDAKGVLDVDGNQADPRPVLGRRPDAVRAAPSPPPEPPAPGRGRARPRRHARARSGAGSAARAWKARLDARPGIIQAGGRQHKRGAPHRVRVPHRRRRLGLPRPARWSTVGMPCARSPGKPDERDLSRAAAGRASGPAQALRRGRGRGRAGDRQRQRTPPALAADDGHRASWIGWRGGSSPAGPRCWPSSTPTRPRGRVRRARCRRCAGSRTIPTSPSCARTASTASSAPSRRSTTASTAPSRNRVVDWVNAHRLQILLVTGLGTDVCVMEFVLTMLSARNHGLMPTLAGHRRAGAGHGHPLAGRRPIRRHHPGSLPHGLPRRVAGRGTHRGLTRPPERGPRHDRGPPQPHRHGRARVRRPRQVRRLRARAPGRRPLAAAVPAHGRPGADRASLFVRRARPLAAPCWTAAACSPAARSPTPRRGCASSPSMPSRWPRRRCGASAPRRGTERITHLIVTTCTGFYAPGLDLQIVERFGLRPGVERTMIGFMGCQAALPGLKLARHIVRSQPTARVLMVNLELCTLHLQETSDLQSVLSFLIFADGCAASIVSAEPVGPRDRRLRLARSLPGQPRPDHLAHRRAAAS